MPVWNTLKSACVLSPPSPERVLQDGLYYEFTRHSPGAVVRMYGKEGQDTPWAVVKFKTWVMCIEDCQGNLIDSTVKLFLKDTSEIRALIMSPNFILFQ